MRGMYARIGDFTYHEKPMPWIEQGIFPLGANRN